MVGVAWLIAFLDVGFLREKLRREPDMAKPKGLDEEQAVRCRRQIALATIAAVIIIAGLWRMAVWFGWIGL